MRDADLKHMFLVRADGSVVSRKELSGPWHGTSLESLRTKPGDTLVIPAQLERGAFVQGLKDWSQIVSQMVLGAAAVNVLK
jgi:hypothetical protein